MKPDPHWRTTNVKRRRTKFCGQADLVPVTGAPLLWTKSTDPKTCEQNDTSEEKLKWKQKQYTVRLTLYSPVVTIRTASLTFNNSTFCPHSVFMCFVWIWGQTAIISLYSIDWLVGFYNWDGVCLLRGTAWVFIYKSAYFQSFKCLMSLWNSVSCGLECSFWQGWVSVSQSVSVIHIYNFCCVCCVESTDDYVSSDGIVRAYWLHN